MANLTKHFTWHEALWLPSWSREALPSDGLDEEIQTNLLSVFETLEVIRSLFMGKPVIIHSAYRPHLYNRQIGGALRSAHVDGLAVDFHIQSVGCGDVRKILLPHLSTLGVRMENNVGGNWIHIDKRDPVGDRFFNP